VGDVSITMPDEVMLGNLRARRPVGDKTQV
jgi:hypothetical protein